MRDWRRLQTHSWFSLERHLETKNQYPFVQLNPHPRPSPKGRGSKLLVSSRVTSILTKVTHVAASISQVLVNVATVAANIAGIGPDFLTIGS